MKKSRFTDSQRLEILAKRDQGMSVEDICRTHQISPATFYKWKNNLATEQDEDKRRLRELELENARLKKMYADLSLNHEILQEGYAIAKKILARPNRKK